MNTNVLLMTLSVLEKKSITDVQQRNDFKEVIWDYLTELITLEPIYVEVTNPAYQHKIYLEKLLTLTDRWKSIGSDVVPTDKVEQFLTTLQDNMREYLNRNLKSDFYQLRKTHYTKLAYSQKEMEIAPPTRLADLREKAFSNIKPNYHGMG